MARRAFQKNELQFLTISKNIKNMGDFNADIENLRNQIYDTAKEVTAIKENMPRLFSYKSKDNNQDSD